MSCQNWPALGVRSQPADADAKSAGRRGAPRGVAGGIREDAPKPWAEPAFPRARDARRARLGDADVDPLHWRRSARNFSDCLTKRRSIAVFARETRTERGNRGPSKPMDWHVHC